MRDHSHYSPDNTGICAHCGQPLPAEHVPSYGDRRAKWPGVLVTLLFHVLLVALALWQQQKETKAPPPRSSNITYVAPLPQGKPKPKQLQQAPARVKQPKPEVAKIERLPDTITLPQEKPREPEPEPPKPVKVAPEEDMMASIQAKRRARGDASTDQPAEESENDRANRIARANIAAANGRSTGDDRNDTGGVFSVTNKTFASADVKFRGWNPNFKRRWLQQVTVERGPHPDIETAIVMQMIELIRKEKKGDFQWDSHRLQRVVTKSARVEDTADLKAFLYLEMFPGYRPPP